MSNRSPQHDDRGDSREQNGNARQAAEALFAPKPQRIEPTVEETIPASAAVRKPRVLAATATAPAARHEPKPARRAHVPRKPMIPAAHLARIRAWLSYGMSAVEVAEMYGVAAGEVERILHRA